MWMKKCGAEVVKKKSGGRGKERERKEDIISSWKTLLKLNVDIIIIP